MDKDIIGLLIALIAVTGGLGLPFFVIYFQNKERRMLIEKGMDPNLVYPWSRPRTDRKSVPSSQGPLLWGCLLTGAGVGILIGYFVSYYTGFNTTMLVNGTAFLFGGLGLIVYYNYWKRTERKKAE